MKRSPLPVSMPTHPVPVITAHWVSALLLVLSFALVLSRELIDGTALRAVLLDGHRGVGLLIGVATLLRFALRLRHPLADTAGESSAWQRWSASAAHGALYVLLLSLPVLGYLLTNARGQAVNLPVLGALPALVAKDLDLADTLEAWHGTAAWTLLALVAAHFAAALWHHRVRRDNVLVAMWPRLARRS